MEAINKFNGIVDQFPGVKRGMEVPDMEAPKTISIHVSEQQVNVQNELNIDKQGFDDLITASIIHECAREAFKLHMRFIESAAAPHDVCYAGELMDDAGVARVNRITDSIVNRVTSGRPRFIMANGSMAGIIQNHSNFRAAAAIDMPAQTSLGYLVGIVFPSSEAESQPVSMVYVDPNMRWDDCRVFAVEEPFMNFRLEEMRGGDTDSPDKFELHYATKHVDADMYVFQEKQMKMMI